MKVVLSVLLLLVVNLSSAQRQRVNYTAIDWHVQSIYATSLDTLALQLTAPYETELEKVRSIFRWITENIAYNVNLYPRTVRTKAQRYQPEEPYDSIIESKSLNERVAYGVLKKKAALCNGYARLFKTLCDYAGLQSEIITGYARSNIGSGKFKSNHTWNAVRIDSAWHLLDATWASGHVSFGVEEFVKQYNDFYFLTPPEQFIRSHYPEDLQWTLLPNPPTLREFQKAPFRHSAFVKYKIKSFTPATGVVDAAIGDTLLFELETTDVERDKAIAADGYYDSTMLLGTPVWAFLKPQEQVSPEKVTYQYTVASDTVEWLHILYNDDVILRYRLNIRKEKIEPTDGVTYR
jgi:hypothetical protein